MLRLRFYLSLFLSFLFFAGSASADTLGQRENFSISEEFDEFGRESVQATLKHTGDQAYYYVEDAYWNNLDFTKQNTFNLNLEDFSQEFDSLIYSKETQFFGSEANPGIDNDPKITILFEDLKKDNGGYFDSANGFPRSKVPSSNQREMISVSADVMLANPDFAKIFLAHEFQHIISFNQKELTHNNSEEVWLNEVRAQYAVSLVGYNDVYANSDLEQRTFSFLQTPSDSLTEWPNTTTDYGIATLFGEYLIEQYGQGILSETIKYNTIGIDSINRYLQSQGKTERFWDILLNWMGAVYLNDQSKDSRLGYKREELTRIKVSPQQVMSLSPSYTRHTFVQSLKDWQPAWHEFYLNSLSGDRDKSFKLEIFGDPIEKFIVSYLAFYNSGAVKMVKIDVTAGVGSAYILNSTEGLNKVIVLSTKGTKTAAFRKSEPASLLSIVGSIVDTKDAMASTVSDGALIRKRGEKEMYVIWGKYKRYLNSEIIPLYSHLDPAKAIELDSAVFDKYTTANYVKYVDEEKVYAVWPDGTKHWLNITPQQWDASHRDWNAIFIINDLELNHYKIGASITR